jgi:hypothetical protein
MIGARLLLLRRKPAAQARRHTQHFKEAFGNRRPGNAFRIAVPGQRLLIELGECHAFENVVGGLPIAEVLLADALQLAAPRMHGINGGQPFRRRIRKRAQHQRLRQRVYRHAGAHAERQCGHGQRRETGRLAQHPPRVYDVLPQIGEPAETALVPALLCNQGRAAHCPPRRQTRFAGIHSRGDVFFGQLLQVIPKLVLEFAIHLRATE